MTLANEGTIDANGTNALVIDTGTNVVTNSGTLEATGSGGLVVNSAVANSGSLVAAGGDLTLKGDVTGAGTATISGAGILEYGGASSATTSFADATGELKLDQSANFAGAISGFTTGDSLDLDDFVFGTNTTLGFSENSAGTGGTLTVSDGAHTANLNLLGQYTAAGFADAAGQNGGALITYTAQTQNTSQSQNLTMPLA
jgi:large repetitive protein